MVVYSVPGQAVQNRCLRLSVGWLARRQDHHPSRCEGSGAASRVCQVVMKLTSSAEALW